MLRAALLLALATVAPAAIAAPATAAAAPTSADSRLKALYESEWQWRLKEQGRLPGTGPGAYADRLPDVDAASQERRLRYWEQVLAELDRIPMAELSPEERINAATFRTMVEISANEARFRTYEAPFNTDTFFWADIAPSAGQGFANAEEYRRYIGRLTDIPRHFDQHVANMRAGLKRGFSLPRVTLTGRDRTIDPYLKPDETNPLYGPLRHMPPTIPAAEQAQLKAEAMAAIKGQAVPAYQSLLRMLQTEYFPNARTTLAAAELPDGRAYYRAMVKNFTTLDLTPEQIHRIGLSEVARIRAEMEAVKAKTGFTGSLPEFMTFLRTDPQFYARTPKELMGAAALVVKRADGRMKDTIGTLPRYRHGVEPVPANLAPIYTGGRGGLENCWFNTYNLPARPLYTLPALALHECTPGHSFQAALALEAPERPDFRKELYFSGYGEGWGLYTEWLGTVMGIYETPYEDFGRLTYEMWRAVRLVIDTGIHEYGWSREKALAYFKENAALSDLEITNEVDRYIAWPGQALAYKLGEIQIRRLRAEAEAKLGPAFDQRIFHDIILGMGAVPLPVLESEIQRWIASGGKASHAR